MTRAYRCEGCDWAWSEEDDSKPPCPTCGSVYYRWLNYREFALHSLASGEWSSSLKPSRRSAT